MKKLVFNRTCGALVLFVTCCECQSIRIRILLNDHENQCSHLFLHFSNRLSGLSPFMGDTEVDTFANITRVDYDFDDEAFDCVSQDAKDFISKLLVHRKEERMTAQECLNFDWLTVENEESNKNKICTDKLKKFVIRRKWQVCCVVFLLITVIQ